MDNLPAATLLTLISMSALVGAIIKFRRPLERLLLWLGGGHSR